MILVSVLVMVYTYKLQRLFWFDKESFPNAAFDGQNKFNTGIKPPGIRRLKGGFRKSMSRVNLKAIPRHQIKVHK